MAKIPRTYPSNRTAASASVSVQYVSREIFECGESALRNCRQQWAEAAAMIEEGQAIAEGNRNVKHRLALQKPGHQRAIGRSGAVRE